MSTPDFPTVFAMHVKKQANRIAIVVDERLITWRDLGRYAAAVSEIGHPTLGKPPRRIALDVRDPTVFVYALFGFLATGCVVIPLPHVLKPAVRNAILLSCGANLVVTDQGGTDHAHALPTVTPPQPTDATTGCELKPNIVIATRADDEMLVLYSSGTTSMPKGAVHTQSSIAHACENAIRHYHVDCRGKTLITSPLYSARAILPMLTMAYAGGTSLVLSEFETRSFQDCLRKHPTVIVDLVPTQFYALLSDSNFIPKSLEKCRFIVCGGATIHRPLRDRLYELFPSNFVEAYGSTETGLISRTPRRAPIGKRGSVGLPRGVEVQFLGDDGFPSTRPSRGEILVHGQSNISGYLSTLDEMVPIFCEDAETGKQFLRTGDIGELDDDGYLWLSGRTKDMIIVAGFNVYAVDIEQIVLQHESVEDAAVVGLEHDVLGEVPVAFVVLEEQFHRSPESEIRSWANALLDSRQKLYDVRIVSSLPRNTSGKVLKAELRELAKQRPGSYLSPMATLPGRLS